MTREYQQYLAYRGVRSPKEAEEYQRYLAHSGNRPPKQAEAFQSYLEHKEGEFGEAFEINIFQNGIGNGRGSSNGMSTETDPDWTPTDLEDYLAHYGVPGMKWGVRQYQNADGSYTAAGAQRYWGGTGTRQYRRGVGNQTAAARRVVSSSRMSSQQRNVASRAAQQSSGKPQLTARQLEARRAKRKKILMIAGGVTVAAALGYAAYKGSTNLRDTMRSDVYKNFDTDFKNLHTLNSKYWDAKDRAEYATRSAKRAKDVAEGITRRDAVAVKIAQTTGLNINLPSSRESVMRERRSMNEYSNFIRSAEKRGAMNRSISDARKELHEAEKKLRIYTNTEHIGTSKQYEQLWTQKHTENVWAARKRLNDLLAKRAA